MDLALITAAAGVCGAAVSGVLVCTFSRIRGDVLATEPGHWLLLIVSVNALVIGVANHVDWSAMPILHWQELAPGQRLAFVFGLGGVQCAVAGSLWLRAAVQSHGFVWKSLFFAAFVTSLTGFILAGADVWLHLANPAFGGPSHFSFAGNISYYVVAPMLAFMLLALAVSQDFRRRSHRRDWLHWTGIAVLTGDALLTLSWGLKDQLA
jgi:hypothetical protein